MFFGRALPALLALMCLSACGDRASGTSSASTSAAASASEAASAVPSEDPVFAAKQCAQTIERATAEPALKGAPAFEAARIELMGRPRGTPLFWKREPNVDAKAPEAAVSAVAKIARAERPLPVVKGLIRRYGKSAEMLRAIFLREGYVFADKPEVALALVETLRITHLFKEPVVYLLRGQSVHMLRREPRTRYLPERYVHGDGPLKDSVAELLLGDRFALETSVILENQAAVDLTSAVADAGFDRMRVKHITEKTLVTDVRSPSGGWVSAAFAIEGARLQLSCVSGPPDALIARQKALAESSFFRKAVAKLRATVHAEVQEEPRFDEPKDEPDGKQQDGTLRREWRRAYEKSLRKYTVGSNAYDVYDEQGRAVPPQVCVDFITDTWERASGTWYQPLPKAAENERPKPAPARLKGGIDFDTFDLENRRSVAELVAFAKRHPEMFDVLDLPPEERIPLVRRSEFFNYLSTHADDFAAGDVLVIFGLKDDGQPHYHSVMIMEQDPITGVPLLVAGNAGRPREQTLEGVMARSPKRSIKHRIRPKAAWLVRAVLGDNSPSASN